MARLRREKPEARGKMLSFRVSESEATYLRGLASDRGMTLAELFRAAIDDYVNREGRRRKTR